MYNNSNGIGLETARAFLEIVKKKHPDMSYSDLWVLAAYVSLEVGRVDHMFARLGITPKVVSILFRQLYLNRDMSFKLLRCLIVNPLLSFT